MSKSYPCNPLTVPAALRDRVVWLYVVDKLSGNDVLKLVRPLGFTWSIGMIYAVLAHHNVPRRKQTSAIHLYNLRKKEHGAQLELPV